MRHPFAACQHPQLIKRFLVASVFFVTLALTLFSFYSLARAASTWYVDPAGSNVPSCGTGPGAAACLTVSYAANTIASAGDTVHVDAGTYTEQVTIGKNLTLQGAGTGSTTIQAPSVLASDSLGRKVVVEVNGGAVVTINGFTIAGPGPGACGSIDYGVYVIGGANLTFQHNVVHSIRDSSLSGCQTGFGLRIGSKALAQTGSGLVDNNNFYDNQKGAIVIDGPGVTATVSNNTVTGNGDTPVTTQNGIEVSRGAVTTVSHNTVSGFAFTGMQYAPAEAILVYNAGNTTVTNNTITASDIGINPLNDDGSTAVATITGNTVTERGHPYDEAIVLGTGWGGSTVTGNTVSGAMQVGGVDLGYPISFGCPNNGTDCVSIAGAGIDIVVPVTIQNNVVFNNTLGVWVEFGGATSSAATQNCLYSNSNFGIENQDTVTFDGTNNWWGTHFGPPTPSGTTPNGVSGPVTFSPFLTAPILGCPDYSPRIDSIGVFRSGTFFLRLHNSTGFADITVGFNLGTKPYPVVGDWTGADFDTVGSVDQTNGLFSLCTANNTTSCAQTVNQISFVLGNPNDFPLSGKWTAGFTHFGAGVFRPSNGLIYLKNNLTTGFADYTMVMGIPGDLGLAGDWNGDGLDSPGVYRPSLQQFYLTDQVCNCSVFGSYQFQYGVAGDSPVMGDWIGQGHDGVGLFRQSNGFTYLRNTLTTGFADITFVYGIAGDIPIAGHWQLVYPPAPNPGDVLVPPTLAPAATVKPPPTGGLGD
ncbi:MAG: right-handed parallel beta-helix repeat-containing protein [Aggregatilineales bacterium]